MIFPWLISIPEFLEQDRAGLVFFDTVHFCTVLYSHFSGHPKLYNPLQSVPVFIQQITSLPRRKEYCKVLGLST